MLNRRHLSPIIRMIRSILHKTVHNMVTLRTKSFIINTWNSQIHKRS
jgi:hypothetical protein